MNTSLKTCFKCGETKPLVEFYAHPEMRDGHLNKCKLCARKDTATNTAKRAVSPAWVLMERNRHREKSKRYRESGRVVYNKHNKNLSVAKWRQLNTLKRKAHNMVAKAIRNGKLIRQQCEICGEGNAQAHHDDYTKPLTVRWLCAFHHGEHHAKERDWLIVAEIELERIAA